MRTNREGSGTAPCTYDISAKVWKKTLGIHRTGYGGQYVGKEGHQAHSSHITEQSMCTGILICMQLTPLQIK